MEGVGEESLLEGEGILEEEGLLEVRDKGCETTKHATEDISSGCNRRYVSPVAADNMSYQPGNSQGISQTVEGQNYISIGEVLLMQFTLYQMRTLP